MRATEIIRGVLDLIDQVECAQAPEPEIAVMAAPVAEPTEPTIRTGDDTRFKHIFAMLGAERANPGMYDNSPNNTTADLDAVTKDASGGLNVPKNPSDIRTNAPSMYPNFQGK
jgi:hypothetical protein